MKGLYGKDLKWSPKLIKMIIKLPCTTINVCLFHVFNSMLPEKLSKDFNLINIFSDRSPY